MCRKNKIDKVSFEKKVETMFTHKNHFIEIIRSQTKRKNTSRKKFDTCYRGIGYVPQDILTSIKTF